VISSATDVALFTKLVDPLLFFFPCLRLLLGNVFCYDVDDKGSWSEELRNLSSESKRMERLERNKDVTQDESIGRRDDDDDDDDGHEEEVS